MNERRTGVANEKVTTGGGVPALMLELRDMLHRDCITVTGKTLDENLEDIERSPLLMRERLGHLSNFKVRKEEIIRPRAYHGLRFSAEGHRPGSRSPGTPIRYLWSRARRCGHFLEPPTDPLCRESLLGSTARHPLRCWP